MCISSSPANFTKTLGFIGEAEKDNKKIHVLGYKNNYQNLTSEPNAMILHFPNKTKMTKENILDIQDVRLIQALTDPFLVKQTQSRSLSNSLKSVEVFDSGSYTIVLSDSAELAYEALKKVPKNKRPKISKELLDWYSLTYPNWTIAICCFDGSQMTDAEPMFWWYEPKDSSFLFFPSMDAHDGKKPDKDSTVEVDHIISFSSIKLNANNLGADISQYKKTILDKKYHNFFPDRVIGVNLTNQYLKNGDFRVSIKDVDSGNLDNLSR